MFAEKTTIGQCNRFLFTLSCFVLSALHYVDCQCWVLCLLMSLLSVECLNSSLLVQYFAQFEYFIYYFTVCGKIIISSHGFTMSVLAASYSHYWLLCSARYQVFVFTVYVCIYNISKIPLCVYWTIFLHIDCISNISAGVFNLSIISGTLGSQTWNSKEAERSRTKYDIKWTLNWTFDLLAIDEWHELIEVDGTHQKSTLSR